MAFNWANIGKSLKVGSKQTFLYEGFPGSDNFEVLAPGEVRGVITSYISRDNENYYQLNDSQYILFEGVEVVSNDEEDTSSFIDRTVAGLGGASLKTKKSVDKTVGYLKDGIEETSKRGFWDMLKYAGKKFELFSDLNKALIVGGILFAVFLVLNITLKIKQL